MYPTDQEGLVYGQIEREVPKAACAPMVTLVLTKAWGSLWSIWKGVSACLRQQCSTFQQHLPTWALQGILESLQIRARWMWSPRKPWQIFFFNSSSRALPLQPMWVPWLGGICLVWIKNCLERSHLHSLLSQRNFPWEHLCLMSSAVSSTTNSAQGTLFLCPWNDDIQLDVQQETLSSNVLCFETIHTGAGKTALGNVKIEWGLTAGDRGEDSTTRCSSKTRDTCPVLGVGVGVLPWKPSVL